MGKMNAGHGRMGMAINLVLLLVVAPAALAAHHRVGGSAGWNLNVDYNAWASGRTFAVDDTLQFVYGASHSVDVVDKQGYDNCDPTRATDSFQDGNSTVTLRAPGPLYFICPTVGHCPAGMKLAINISGGGSPAPGSGPPASAPSPSGGSSPPPTAANPPEASPPEASPPGASPPEGKSQPPPAEASGAMSPEGESSPQPAPGANGASRGLSCQMAVAWTVVLGSAVMFMG